MPIGTEAGTFALPPGLGTFVGGVLTKSTPAKTLIGKGGVFRGAGKRHPSGAVAGIDVPESFRELLPDTSGSISPFGQNYVNIRFGFGQPFNVGQFRNAAAITSPDSRLITDYFSGIKPFLSDIGRGDISTELDTLTAGFNTAANFQELRARQNKAVQIAGAIRGELAGQLGENPEALNRFKAFEQGFRNTQQLRLLEREKAELETSGFDFGKVGAVPGGLDVGEFEVESVRRNKELSKTFTDRLGELGQQIPELRERIEGGGLQPANGTGKTRTEETPEVEEKIKRVIMGAARHFARIPLPKQKFAPQGFTSRGFVPPTSMPPPGGSFFDLEKEEDLIIPSGFTSKLATTQSRALALKGLR